MDSATTMKKLTRKEILKLENCTKCGRPFKEVGGKFPYPENQVLCKECFFPALDEGLARLNKVLAGEL